MKNQTLYIDRFSSVSSRVGSEDDCTQAVSNARQQITVSKQRYGSGGSA